MSDSLYDIFHTKCFALAHTTVIHNTLAANTQNIHLEALGFKVNPNNRSTWRYYKNLTGEYHDYDKATISQINPDGHPYMRIKIAGDNKPVEVDFVKELVTGNTGDYSLAAEYSYGSDYYTELVNKYPGCETLILGILNPIDEDVAINSKNGDILYCGGYYRRLVPNVMKEMYGFEKRGDVIIDAEFLVEDWEEDLIHELQEYVTTYVRRWEVPDFANNHSFYPEAIRIAMQANLVPVIEKIRLKNYKTYAAHSFHVREYINSYGYLGEHVDALTRDQQMYLYYNIKWLAANKGKEKTLEALIENLLTPSNIPLVAYNLGHYNWDMTTRTRINSLVEFNREPLNMSDVPDVIGLDIKKMIIKEHRLARDNPLNVDDQVAGVEFLSAAGSYNDLKTKVLESNYRESDGNQFFNLEEFQYNIWMLSSFRGDYHGSIFVTHPGTGGRFQLTPKTALILFHYVYVKGFVGYTLEKPLPIRVRNIPKTNPAMYPELEAYPTDEMLWEHISTDELTPEKVNALKKFPPPVFKYTSSTDFNVKTTEMFETLEARQSLASREEDIAANAELELAVAKFYHLWIFLDPLADVSYEQWFSIMGINLKGLSDVSLRALAMELYAAGMGKVGLTGRSAADMHSSMLNVVNYFLSYTVQLVGKYSNSSARMYGYKHIRLSYKEGKFGGVSQWRYYSMDFIEVKQIHKTVWSMELIKLFSEAGRVKSTGNTEVKLIDLVIAGETCVKVKTHMELGGFSMRLPWENNGVNLPVDKFKFKRAGSVKSQTKYPERFKVIGGTISANITPAGGRFINTYGLDKVTVDDFEFRVSKV